MLEQTVEAWPRHIDQILEVSLGRTVAITQHEELRSNLLALQVRARRQQQEPTEVAGGKLAKRDELVVRRIRAHDVQLFLQERHMTRLDLRH